MTPCLYSFLCSCLFYHIHCMMRESNNSLFPNHTKTLWLVLLSFTWEGNTTPYNLSFSTYVETLWKIFHAAPLVKHPSYLICNCQPPLHKEGNISTNLPSRLMWNALYITWLELLSHIPYSHRRNILCQHRLQAILTKYKQSWSSQE